MRVRATASATSTTETPAALTARMNWICSTIRPASEIATVSAEKTTVRPARSIVVAVASTTWASVSSATGAPCSSARSSSRKRRHDEQPVVDAQAEREHGDHVDDGGVQVEQVGEAEQGGQGAGDRGDRADDREPGGEEPAEHDDHHREAHRQRDALAALAVDLDLFDDPVDQAAQAAALVAARAGLLGQPVEDLVDRGGGRVLLLGRVVGVEGDDGRETPGCRVAVEGQPQGGRAGGPLGHDERVDRRLHVLDAGEVLHGGGRRGRHGGVGEVDPGEGLGVGAETAAAPRGEQVAAGLVLAVDDDLAAVEPVEQARGAERPEGHREPSTMSTAHTTTTVRARRATTAPQRRSSAPWRGSCSLMGHSVPEALQPVAGARSCATVGW